MSLCLCKMVAKAFVRINACLHMRASERLRINHRIQGELTGSCCS